jgi:predicted helicase
MIHRRGQWEQFFPTPDTENRVLCVSGIGVTKDWSVLISDRIADVQLMANGQCFPLYWYEKVEDCGQLFGTDGAAQYVRRDGVSDFLFGKAREKYGHSVTKEDIFYYIYGILHHPKYRRDFADDLKKELPRLPLIQGAEKFKAFTKAGRELAELHINYEAVPPSPDVIVTGSKADSRVQKMRFPKKGQKDTIIYNHFITISNIPEKAYDYVVNGKSAIEWVMERYQVKEDGDSGIENDPNQYADEIKKPDYILNLLLSVVSVSIKTAIIVDEMEDSVTLSLEDI